MHNNALQTSPDAAIQPSSGGLYRIIICDDDSNALDQIKENIASYFQKADVHTKVHCFSSPEQISDQLLTSCDIALMC